MAISTCASSNGALEPTDVVDDVAVNPTTHISRRGAFLRKNPQRQQKQQAPPGKPPKAVDVRAPPRSSSPRRPRMVTRSPLLSRMLGTRRDRVRARGARVRVGRPQGPAGCRPWPRLLQRRCREIASRPRPRL